MNHIEYFDYTINHKNILFSARGVRDQVISATTKGVLNPEVFHSLQQSYNFYLLDIPIDHLENSPSKDYAQQLLTETKTEPSQADIFNLQKNLTSLSGDIFSLPSGLLSWRIKAPLLISSIVSQGQVRPVCGFYYPQVDGGPNVAVHPGKKRLSVMRFLGWKNCSLILQVEKEMNYDWGGYPLNSIDDICEAFGTKDLYFRTHNECLLSRGYRLEVQSYDESHRRINNNLISWEDSLDLSFISKRYDQLKLGIDVFVRDTNFDQVKQSIEQFFSYKKRKFCFSDEAFHLNLNFKPLSALSEQKTPISLIIRSPVRFCISNLLLFLYTHREEIHFGSEVTLLVQDSAVPPHQSDMFQRAFTQTVLNSTRMFESWSNPAELKSVELRLM